jgi:hypothetical protein
MGPTGGWVRLTPPENRAHTQHCSEPECQSRHGPGVTAQPVRRGLTRSLRGRMGPGTGMVITGWCDSAMMTRTNLAD